MMITRKLLGVLVAIALGVFAGCGKKKQSVEVKKQAEADVVRLAEQENSFVFDDSDENFKLEEFSFVEDEDKDNEGQAATGERVAQNDDSDFAVDELPVELEAVHFGFDSDKPLKKDKTVFNENIKAAKKASDDGKEVTVRAYCCEIGSPDYNQALSERRAQAIKKEMVAHGVDQKKINALGCGQENQVAWSDAQDRLTRIRELAPNRRAEFEFVRGA